MTTSSWTTSGTPDDYLPAEVAVDYFRQHVGVERRTKGDRAAGIAGDLRPYVLPFLLELADSKPTAKRGLTYQQLWTPRFQLGRRSDRPGKGSAITVSPADADALRLELDRAGWPETRSHWTTAVRDAP